MNTDVIGVPRISTISLKSSCGGSTYFRRVLSGDAKKVAHFDRSLWQNAL